jgi:tetratricopeptide (TPR) repeat protein
MTGITKEAYENVLNLDFEKASALLPDPRTPQELYVISFAQALELIITEDRKRFQHYESLFETRASQKHLKGPDALLLQAEMQMQWAFVYLKFGQELDAAFRLRQAYQLTQEIRKKYPDYRPALKSSGLLNVLIGSVPDKYNWILSLLNMQGSVPVGLAQMKTLSQSGHPLAFEATLWHAFIQGFVLQHPDKAIDEMAQLLATHPENPVVLFLAANFHIKNSNSEAALALLQRAADLEAHVIPYVSYLTGEVYLHKAEYDRAIRLYGNFLDKYKGINYIKDTHYKIGLCYWLHEKPADAAHWFRLARIEGQEATEADKHAARNLESAEPASVPLTRIRYYTDGGYYNEATALVISLNEHVFDVKKHQAEYYYRKARLAHKQKDTAEARGWYMKTIDWCGREEWYFAPNSCLQLGYIEEESGNISNAKAYFEKALSYRKHEYKNSIDSKARSALSQLKRLR